MATRGAALLGCRRPLLPLRCLALAPQVAHVHTFRQNAITGDWVVFAKDRAARPVQTQHYVPKPKATDILEHLPSCPFCRGNEHLTPASLLEIPGQDTEEWTLRIVPNKFPAVSSWTTSFEDASADEQQSQIVMQRLLEDDNPLSNTVPAYGHHEVIIESPRHNAHLALEPVSMTNRLVRAWHGRGRALREDPRVRHVHFFRNQGGAAGASLVHPHSQVVALPIVSAKAALRMEQARSFFVRQQVSVFQRIVDLELTHKERVVEENKSFVAVTPYASISPYEILILPREGHPYFEDASSAVLDDFAQLLHNILRRLHVHLDEPSYNLLIHTAPQSSRQAYDYEKFYSWHCSIHPRLGAGAMAGFEIGTGIFSNSKLPEECAEALRATAI